MKWLKLDSRDLFFILSLLILLLLLFLSPLVFFPLPWPDDSAFVLAGMDWEKSGVFRMLSQSPWVESYDQFNFNTMPYLPLAARVLSSLGVKGVLGFRFWMCFFPSLATLILFYVCGVLVRVPFLWRMAVTLCFLFSPWVSAGMVLIRPEIFQLLSFLAIVFLFLVSRERVFQGKNSWIGIFFEAGIGFLLGFAATTHFEAVYLVPSVIVLLLSREASWKDRFRGVLVVGVVTLLTLSPWIVYAALNFKTFLFQMHTQFERLEEKKFVFKNGVDLFHSFFVRLGSPVDLPKWFNLGAISTAVLFVFSRGSFRASSNFARASSLAFLFSAVLYVTKPESWFLILVHGFGWIAVLLSVPPLFHVANRAGKVFKVALAALLFLILGSEITLTAHEFTLTRAKVNVENYRAWTRCLGDAIEENGLNSSASLASKPLTLWQPNWPDALIDVCSRFNSLDCYRAIDFRVSREKIEAFAVTTDFIFHTVLIPVSDEKSTLTYSGAPREWDKSFFLTHPWIAESSNHSFETGVLKNTHEASRVCQSGPFWGMVLRKISQ